jgi:hypothetical protein
MAAAIGQPQVNEDFADEINAKIMLKWAICGGVDVTFGIGCVIFYYWYTRRRH